MWLHLKTIETAQFNKCISQEGTKRWIALNLLEEWEWVKALDVPGQILIIYNFCLSES